MKLAIVAMAIMLLSSAHTWAQQSRYGIPDHVELRLSRDINDSSSAVMQYGRLGVMFHVAGGGRGVTDVAVFPPALREGANQVRRVIGDSEVVPGLGAYGVPLGMSKEAVRSTLCRGFTADQFRKMKGVSCNLPNSRRLYVFFSDSKVASLIAYGPFRTPEGITQNSRATEISRTYGTPSRYYIEGGRSPAWGLAPFVVMPVLGLMTGLHVRWLRRRVWRSGRMVLAITILSGGAMASVGAMLSSVLTNAFLINGQLLALFLVSSAVSGMASTAVLECLGNHLNSCLGRLMMLCCMLLAVIAGHWIVAVTWPGVAVGVLALWPVAAINGLFAISLFLSAMKPHGAS